jgi:AcrR family transcriptional regulator
MPCCSSRFGAVRYGYSADMDGLAADSLARLRRIPQQSRSRVRVERILDTAAEQVVALGVDAVGTRGIADAAGVPVASLYQYFADKDTILLALVERDLRQMADLVLRAVDELPRVTVATLVEAALDAFVTAYRQRPAFIMIWLRGRNNPAIRQYCTEHNRRIAVALFEHGVSRGLFDDRAEPCHAEIAIEVGDHLFEKAFADDMDGDPMVLAEARKAVTAYLELYASADGLEGVEGQPTA